MLVLGRRLTVRATPTIFLANGEQIRGAVSKMDLEIALSSPQVMLFQASAPKKGVSARR